MNIKKLSALILSGAFVLSFAGCGNSEPATSSLSAVSREHILTSKKIMPNKDQMIRLSQK
ncbi:MAG: hypothetical protein IKG30_00585 [Clostridiales bacterium]|nr:hypothetical protein [Clostridiales bacterium]